MYNPTDEITITIPRHTAHLLNAYASHTIALADRTRGTMQKRNDDQLALIDFIQAYAEAISKR